jgi:hypothetical protein
VPSIEVVPPVKVVLTPVEVQTFDVTVSAPNPVVQVVSEGPQGPSGAAGPTGAQGPTGEPGVVISPSEPDDLDVLWADTSEEGDAVLPLGGAAGQSLVKVSGDDYDTTWADPAVTTAVAPITYDFATRTVATDGSIFRMGLGRPNGISEGPQFAALCTTVVSVNTHAIGGGAPRRRYSPILISKTVTISEALAHVTAAAVSGTADWYIFDADTDWQPIAGTNRTVATGVDVATPGAKVITGLNITLTPGRYILHFVTDAGPTIRLWGAIVPDGQTITSASNQLPGTYFLRSDAADLDAKWGATSTFSGGGVQQSMLFKWVYA